MGKPAFCTVCLNQIKSPADDFHSLSLKFCPPFAEEMEKERETSLFSRIGDSGCSSVIRTGITLPDDSNGSRGQLTQLTAGRRNRLLSTVTPPETTSCHGISLYLRPVCTIIHHLASKKLAT